MLRGMRVPNPFVPGFGKPPAVLAGRSESIERLIHQIRHEAPAQHLVVGPRGVGKTVLLQHVRDVMQHDYGAVTVSHMCDASQEVPQALARKIIMATKGLEPWWERFCTALSKRLIIEVDKIAQVSSAPFPNENFHPDTILSDTLAALGEAAAANDSHVLLVLDELQSLDSTTDLVRIGQALSETNERGDRISMIGAGLRKPVCPAGSGGTFFERIETTELRNLGREQTKRAFKETLRLVSLSITPDGLDHLTDKTRGYPYYLQMYGYSAVQALNKSPKPGNEVTKHHALLGVEARRAHVDQLYQSRFDKLGPLQQAVLVAGARCADQQDCFSIGNVAAYLNRKTTELSNARKALIEPHQLLEPTTRRGELRFVLPDFGRWAMSQGLERLSEQANAHLPNDPATFEQ